MVMLEGGFGDFYFLFSRQGAGKVKIEVKSVRPKNNELLPSGLNHGSDNKFKTTSLSALLPIWTLKNRVNPAKRVLRTEPFLEQKK